VTTWALSNWDLCDLLPEPTEEVISQRIAGLVAAVESFEEIRPRLAEGIGRQELLDTLRHYEKLLAQMAVLGGYAHLWLATETQSSKALTYRHRICQVLAQAENRFLFFTLWWKGLGKEEALRLLPTAELEATFQEVGDFRHYLLDLRRFTPHTLDERSEQIINLKNANGVEAVVALYSMLISRFEFHLEVDGESQVLTDAEMRRYFGSPDPEVRKNVFQEMFRVVSAESSVLSQIYHNRVRDWHSEYVGLRGGASPISMRNLSNDIPDDAVRTLLDVVHQNAPLFHDYFRLKAGWLGMERLRRYDIYAPLTSTPLKVDFSDAAQRVLDTFYKFDRKMGKLAEQVFAERHIDSKVRKGKEMGAFCTTVGPELTPWVLLNYTGRPRDVAMLAHELGHAVHSMLASGHSLLTQQPSLALAETASVFAEMMITDQLLTEEADPVVRRELLASAIDYIYATVMRQSYLVRFEIAAHDAVLANKPSEDLCDLYFQNLKEQFGTSVEVTSEFRYEWLLIPPFFTTPFYCYAYSFGQLLVLALYRRYQEEQDAFKPGYLKLLTYGGSVRPAEVLREMGIDITDASFWQGGFEVVRDMLAELQAIDSELEVEQLRTKTGS
jgi:oligoendopeptidase F